MKQLKISNMKGNTKEKKSARVREPPVVTPTEKSRKETKPPTSQELAKDPGPGELQRSQLTKMETINRRVLKASYSLKYFAGIASMAVEGPAGSKVLQAWRKEFPHEFLEPAQHYAAPMQHDVPTTWEEAAETVFQFCKTMDNFEKYLYWSWDRENYDNERGELDVKNQWNIRRFSEAIASQDPTVLFDIKAKNIKGLGDSLSSKYWDNSNWYNPKLNLYSHVLAQFWVLCATTLGHPWTESQERDVDGVYSWRMTKKRAVQESKMRKRNRLYDVDAGRARAPHAPTTPEKPSFQSQKTSTENSQEADVEMQDAEPTQMNFTSLVARTVDVFKSARKSNQQTSELKSGSDGDSTGENSQSSDDETVRPRRRKKVQIQEDTEPSSEDKKLAASDVGVKGRTKTFTMGPLQLPPRQLTSTKVWPPDNQNYEEIDKSSSDENQWTDEGIVGPPEVKASSKSATLSALGMRTPERGRSFDFHHEAQEVQEEKEGDDEGLAPGEDVSLEDAEASNRPYSSVAATPPRLLSEEEKISKLVQLNMEGLPVPNCSIFVLRIPFKWNGSNGGKSSITRQVLQLLHNLWEGLFQIHPRFKVLPIKDDRYKNQKLWITNKASAKILMGHWHQAKNYTDMAFGNGEWLSSLANKTGDKTYTTRIRVAYDDTDEGAMSMITSVLDGFDITGGRCLPSPIQFCPAVRTGCFPFYPLEMSIPMLVKFIIKHLDFAAAIGIEPDWMSIPSNRNRNTWKAGASFGRGNGIKLLHVWTKEEDAKMVDSALRCLFRPSTPKKDFPYGAVTQYVHDWKAVQKKQLSVGPYRPVRDLVTTMAQKAIDFESVTETFCAPLPIPGMLKRAVTQKYGEISLLRLLLAIVATPAQADQATEQQTQQPGESNGEEENDEDDDDEAADGEAVQLPGAAEGFFQVVEPKQSAKLRKAEKLKQAKLAQAAEKALYSNQRPGADEALKRSEMVQLKDRENRDPGLLFQLITPEHTTGYYCLTSRHKFVPLAVNVANGLAAFIAYHLEETSRKRENEIIGKWLGTAELAKLRRRNLVWDPETMSARPASDTNRSHVDNSLDWLEFGRDVLDQTSGYLAIDMEMADVRDFDDGATVAGALDELRAAEDKIEEMFQEVSFYEDVNAQLEKDKAALAARVAELEARQSAASPDNSGHSRRRSARAGRGGSSSTNGS